LSIAKRVIIWIKWSEEKYLSYQDLIYKDEINSCLKMNDECWKCIIKIVSMSDGWYRGITKLLTIVGDANVAIDRLQKYEEKNIWLFLGWNLNQKEEN
jgi:hypothetical protein